MKQNEFINLIDNPYGANATDIEKLLDLKKQFPFFQSAHMLLTLVSKKYDSSVYQQTLKQTAISIPNRAWLHNLLNLPEPKITEQVSVAGPVIEPPLKVEEYRAMEPADEKPSEIEHLKAIELSTGHEKTKEEKLNELVEKEIQKDIITAFIEKEVLKTPEWYKKEEKKEQDKESEPLDEIKTQISSGSFADWLQALKKSDRVEHTPNEKTKEEEKKPVKKEIKQISEEEKNAKKAKQQALIDKIIEVNPSTIRLDPNQRFYAADVKAKESLIENEDLVTETLAKIYALQGNISKAVRAYEILSLKFPQKSAYFATLIQNLKKQNQ